MSKSDFHKLWVLLLLAAISCGKSGSKSSTEPVINEAPADSSSSKRLKEIEDSERVIDVELRPPVRKLTKSALNLSLPGASSNSVFLPDATIVDVTGVEEPAAIEVLGGTESLWALGTSRNLNEGLIWANVFADVHYFKHAKFKVKRGEFAKGDRSIFSSIVLFRGVGQTESALRSYRGKIQVTWKLHGKEWKISKWKTKALHSAELPEAAYTEVSRDYVDTDTYAKLSPSLDSEVASIMARVDAGMTEDDARIEMRDWGIPFSKAEVDQVLAKREKLEREVFHHQFASRLSVEQTSTQLGVDVARVKELEDAMRTELEAARKTMRPEAHERIQKAAQRQKKVRSEYGEPIKTYNRAVTVGDFDRDGWPDIFVSISSKNMLLRNKAGQGFEDVADAVGLNKTRWTTRSALFLDVDNDGDSDLVAGVDGKVKLFINEKGTFNDQSELVSLTGDIRYLAAGDYNRDGLIDLYLLSDGAFKFEFEIARKLEWGMDDGQLMRHSLSEKQAKELYRRTMSDDVDPWFDRPSSPSVLLRNEGRGRFTVAPSSDGIANYAIAQGAVFSDFDQDGDPDLYIATDYASNQFLRNDGPEKWTDITEETNTSDASAGMGAHFADFDRDGQLDLYVTNMYSKAGTRIYDGLNDERGTKSARGNSLFRQTKVGSFKRVSGTEGTAQRVQTGGWSWGAQFLDVNNDGFLDVFSPSGFITPPPQFADWEDT